MTTHDDIYMDIDVSVPKRLGNMISHRHGSYNKEDLDDEKKTTPPDQYIKLLSLRLRDGDVRNS